MYSDAAARLRAQVSADLALADRLETMADARRSLAATLYRSAARPR